MLSTLTTRHQYPGKLFVVEGIDGSGKTTQLGLLAKWLTARGHRVFVTEWNSSTLVKAATKAGKKKNGLAPTTFSLLHATDVADRLEKEVVPALQAGFIVLADFRAYQGKLLREYSSLGEEFGFWVVDARQSVERIQEDPRRQISTFLPAPAGAPAE